MTSLPYFRALMTQKQIDIFYKYTEEEGPRKGEIYGEERLFKSSLEARSNQRYYIKCPDGSFAIPPGKTMPEVLEDGAAVTPLKTDKVWKWIYPRYKQELDAGNIIFKRTDTSGLVDENGNQCKWNIYNKLWLNEQQEKGVVPSNLIAGYENRQSAAELKDLQLGFNYAKPVGLVQYLLTISRLNKNAVILDSFAGSGTTAHAVLEMNKEDGGSRKFILIETEDYADSITAERVKRTIVGYKKDVKNVLYNQEITAKNLKNGADYIKEAKEISKESKTDGGYSKVSQPKLKDGYLTVVGTKKDADFEKGLGGDFSYYELGEPLLTDGNLNESVGIDKIREYVYYMDTKAQPVPVDPEEQYLLGVHYGTAYYFYYDKDSVTTLNRESLHMVKKKADSYVIYADLCMLSDSELEKFHITFKKIPRDISKL